MTNDFSQQVGYHLVRPDPRIKQDWPYPFSWIPQVVVALAAVGPSVLDRAEDTLLVESDGRLYSLLIQLQEEFYRKGAPP